MIRQADGNFCIYKDGVYSLKLESATHAKRQTRRGVSASDHMESGRPFLPGAHSAFMFWIAWCCRQVADHTESDRFR